MHCAASLAASDTTCTKMKTNINIIAFFMTSPTFAYASQYITQAWITQTKTAAARCKCIVIYKLAAIW